MSEANDELLEMSASLSQITDAVEGAREIAVVNTVKESAISVGNSFSGSWLGYHSRVYYDGFQTPPPGAHFSQEWGLMDVYGTSLGSHGNWLEQDPDDVVAEIYRRARRKSIDDAKNTIKRLEEKFGDARSTAISILSMALKNDPDEYLSGLRTEVESLELMTAFGVAQLLQPQGQIITRDMNALGQKSQQPPHIRVLSECLSIQHSIGVSHKLADLVQKAGSHLGRTARKAKTAAIVGTNVFIGHGRSPQWRDLKDFVQGRLKLPWDEFNRVPVAGITNIQRLVEMLDAAAIAFLVMTGEDEHDDGKTHARMNVVHEAGLFQGRLGFTKAIVLIEDGCAEFSNIHGLGQIRFPKGNLKAVFEEIRTVLEREGLIEVQ